MRFSIADRSSSRIRSHISDSNIARTCSATGFENGLQYVSRRSRPSAPTVIDSAGGSFIMPSYIVRGAGQKPNVR